MSSSRSSRSHGKGASFGCGRGEGSGTTNGRAAKRQIRRKEGATLCETRDLQGTQQPRRLGSISTETFNLASGTLDHIRGIVPGKTPKHLGRLWTRLKKRLDFSDERNIRFVDNYYGNWFKEDLELLASQVRRNQSDGEVDWSKIRKFWPGRTEAHLEFVWNRAVHKRYIDDDGMVNDLAPQSTKLRLGRIDLEWGDESDEVARYYNTGLLSSSSCGQSLVKN